MLLLKKEGKEGKLSHLLLSCAVFTLCLACLPCPALFFLSHVYSSALCPLFTWHSSSLCFPASSLLPHPFCLSCPRIMCSSFPHIPT